MKPVNLSAKLAAAETELACLRLMLAQVREARDELRQERDDWQVVIDEQNRGGRPLIVVSITGTLFCPFP